MRGKRQAAEARGRWAERVAMLILTLKGYRLLDHRARTAAGEVDLVAQRGGDLVFVEVKGGPGLDEGESEDEDSDDEGAGPRGVPAERWGTVDGLTPSQR